MQVDLNVELAGVRTLVEDGRYSRADSLGRSLLRHVQTAYGARALETARALDAMVETRCRGGDGGKPEVRALAERAVSIKEEHLGATHTEVATSLHHLGAALRQAGEYSEARPLLERSLAIRKRTWGAEHLDVAASERELGVLFIEIDDLDAARSLLEHSVRVRERLLGPDHPSVAQGLVSLGSAISARDELGEAKNVFLRALDIREAALRPTHPEIAGALNNVALLEMNVGDLAEAEVHFQRALQIQEAELGPDHPRVATTLANLAVVESKIGRKAECWRLYDRALRIFRSALGPYHPRLASHMAEYGELRRADGDLRAAKQALRQALEILERAYGPQHLDVAACLQHLGQVYEALGDLGRAQALVERALAVRETKLGAEHVQVAESSIALADLLALSGDDTKALNVALRAEETCREHLRLTARSLPERQARSYSDLRDSGLALAMWLAARKNDGSTTRQVWEAVIRSRALVFDEMVTRNRVVARDRNPEVVVLAESLRSARRHHANLLVRASFGPGIESQELLVRQARVRREEAERRLADKSLTFRDEQDQARIGFSAVEARLRPGDALVAYAVLRHSGSGRGGSMTGDPSRGIPTTPTYMVFVQRGGHREPTAVLLGAANEIDALVADWRRRLVHDPRDLRLSPRQAEAACRAAGEALRRRVWDPLDTQLRGATRVFVVPDGALHLVNWNALPVAADRYLIEEDAAIHILSAERDLVPSTRQSAVGSGALILGAPAFDGERSSRTARRLAEVEGSTDVRSTRPASALWGESPFKPLPAADREAREVAALCSQRGKATCLTGENASEAAFMRQAPGRRIVHLATHAFFLEGTRSSSERGITAVVGANSRHLEPRPAFEKPLPLAGLALAGLALAGLALAGANRTGALRDGEEDGILTAEEIASVDLQGVELAVLSACDTGVGEIQVGEGVFGLRRAFQVAGARTVIMSLWPVQDEVARNWMQALYRARLVEGMATMSAVREANLHALRTSREIRGTAHPYYWAGFVAVGDWT